MTIEVMNETLDTEARINEHPYKAGTYQIQFKVPQSTYKAAYAEWLLESAKLSKGVFICMSCGKINSHFRYTCADCTDPNGGDGPDD